MQIRAILDNKAFVVLYWVDTLAKGTNEELAEKAMRPSATLNAIIDAI